jgi:hypothetical protein
MRRHERPPILDYLVFGTAAVLALIVGYYALFKQPWRRPDGHLDQSEATGEPSLPPALPEPPPVVPENTLVGSGTHAIATETPGVKSVGRAAPKRKKKR